MEDTSKIQEGESVPKENHVEPQNVDTEEQKQEDGTIPENDNEKKEVEDTVVTEKGDNINSPETKEEKNQENNNSEEPKENDLLVLNENNNKEESEEKKGILPDNNSHIDKPIHNNNEIIPDKTNNNEPQKEVNTEITSDKTNNNEPQQEVNTEITSDKNNETEKKEENDKNISDNNNNTEGQIETVIIKPVDTVENSTENEKPNEIRENIVEEDRSRNDVYNDNADLIHKTIDKKEEVETGEAQTNDKTNETQIGNVQNVHKNDEKKINLNEEANDINLNNELGNKEKNNLSNTNNELNCLGNPLTEKKEKKEDEIKEDIASHDKDNEKKEVKDIVETDKNDDNKEPKVNDALTSNKKSDKENLEEKKEILSNNYSCSNNDEHEIKHETEQAINSKESQVVNNELVPENSNNEQQEVNNRVVLDNKNNEQQNENNTQTPGNNNEPLNETNNIIISNNNNNNENQVDNEKETLDNNNNNEELHTRNNINIISENGDTTEAEKKEKNNFDKNLDGNNQGTSMMENNEKDDDLENKKLKKLDESKQTSENIILSKNNTSSNGYSSSSSSDTDEESLNDSCSCFISTTSKKEKEYIPKGIENLGLNCYMNSLLQCLFNIPDLRKYFINGLKNKKFKKESTPICYYFAKVMKSLFYSNKDFIKPKKFKKHISKKNSLFRAHKAADATDLFRNLIDSFINEIDNDSQCLNGETDTPEGDIIINKETLYNEINNERRNNYFYSLLNIYNIVTYECPFHTKNEDNKTYSIESDSNITFYLEKIAESRKNRYSTINIKDCFEHIQKEKNNNQFFCNHCKKIVTGKSKEKIFYPPDILTIILNRGHGKTFKGNVQIDTILNISDYIDREGKILNNYNDDEEYYRLIGSCNHSGDSSPSGHYTATCYNEENNSYYFYNDRYVRQIDYYRYAGEPYILFYKRMKFKDNIYPSDLLTTIPNNADSNSNKEEYKKEYKEEYIKTLEKVLFYLRSKQNKHYDVEKYDNQYLFIWKVTIKEKELSLIMNFSDPPKYDLSSITTSEKDNSKIAEYYSFTRKIDLNEKDIDIFEKIDNFLENIYKGHVKGIKCPICIII